jgi:hypothetical protein
MSDDIDSLKEVEKEKLAFADSDFLADEQNNRSENHNHVASGLILVTVGVIFLLITVFGLALQNWWAIFIFIPGLSKLVHAGQQYQRDGRFSHCARSNFTWGLVLILVACAFFFSWNWGGIWPIFLIIFGIGALLNGLLG